MERKEVKVVVGVDESEESMFALSWCITNLVADTPNVKLLLLYVKPPPPVHAFNAAICMFYFSSHSPYFLITSFLCYLRVVVGSVSDYCASHAKCAVVIVKQP
uniref:UspA domain-containing protein n=1 Tax=Cajanus cajan TaxID=3821 RepID=A0A151RYP7_CAJCA|nr:hypothetical protein KK1_030762 [Cajanus cajan]